MGDKKVFLLNAMRQFLKNTTAIEKKLLTDEDNSLKIYKNSSNKKYRNAEGRVLTVLYEIPYPLTESFVNDCLTETKNGKCRYYTKEEDILHYRKKYYVLSNNLYPKAKSDLDNLLKVIKSYIDDETYKALKNCINYGTGKKEKKDTYKTILKQNTVEVNDEYLTNNFNNIVFKKNDLIELFNDSLEKSKITVLSYEKQSGNTERYKTINQNNQKREIYVMLCNVVSDDVQTEKRVVFTRFEKQATVNDNTVFLNVGIIVYRNEFLFAIWNPLDSEMGKNSYTKKIYISSLEKCINDGLYIGTDCKTEVIICKQKKLDAAITKFISMNYIKPMEW